MRSLFNLIKLNVACIIIEPCLCLLRLEIPKKASQAEIGIFLALSYIQNKKILSSWPLNVLPLLWKPWHKFFNCCFLAGFLKGSSKRGWHGFPLRTRELIIGSCLELFITNQQNSRLHYIPTSANSLPLIRVSNSCKGSDRSVSLIMFMGSALAPEQLASP